MEQIAIFANGIIDDVTWIRPILTPSTYIIAADGGSHHLRRLGIPPHLLIGDLDSISADLVGWLEQAGTTIISHPPAKDETDLELALLHAVHHHAGMPLLLFGLLGGRLDQTLANVLLLTHPRLLGQPIKILRRTETAWLITGTAEIHGRPGDTVSLIPLGGDVQVRRTNGLAWPLRDETLAFGPARGISNSMTGAAAVVEISQGLLLCIHHYQ